jgi:dipeptidyl aminopeptidase/acylaminoacyl peptidase
MGLNYYISTLSRAMRPSNFQTRSTSILASLFFCGLTLTATAQTSQQDLARQFFATKLISSIRVSPTGRHVAFVTSENNFPLDRTISTVWLIDLNSARQRTGISRLTSEDNVLEPKWSSDGRFLAARVSSHGEPSRLWIFDSKTRRSVTFTDPQKTEDGINAFDWDPSSQSLLFSSNNLGVGERKPKSPNEVIPFGSWGESHDLTKFYRLRPGASAAERSIKEVASIRDYDPDEFIVSPDGRSVALRVAGAIFLLDMSSKQEPRRSTPGFPCFDPGMTWTSRGIVFQACGVVNNGRTERTQRKIYILHPENGKLEQLAVDFTGEFWIEGVAENGDIYLLGNTSTTWDVYKIASGAAIADKVSTAVGPIRQISSSRTGNVFAFTRLQQQPEVYVGQDVSRESTKMTDLNSGVPKFETKVEAVSWQNKDGDVVEGLLYYPYGQAGAKNLPTVVYLHGGPWIAQTEPFYYGLNPLFMNEAYYFAKRGYLVFAPNYRGSAGRGDSFLQAQRGYPCSRLTQDVLTGVDQLIEKKIVDPSRLGIMGSSYGGQLTNCVISRDSRFKAAAVQSGVWNLVSAREVLNGKAPWDDLQKFWDESAISRASKIKTPTLISIGDADEAVNPEHAREESRTFNRIRVANELLIFPGEKHRFFKPSNKLTRLEAQTKWFDHYLRGAPLP